MSEQPEPDSGMVLDDEGNRPGGHTAVTTALWFHNAERGLYGALRGEG